MKRLIEIAQKGNEKLYQRYPEPLEATITRSGGSMTTEMENFCILTAHKAVAFNASCEQSYNRNQACKAIIKALNEKYG